MLAYILITNRLLQVIERRLARLLAHGLIKDGNTVVHLLIVSSHNLELFLESAHQGDYFTLELLQVVHVYKTLQLGLQLRVVRLRDAEVELLNDGLLNVHKLGHPLLFLVLDNR